MKIGIPVNSGKTQYNINLAYPDFVAGAGYEPVLITPRNDPLHMAELCDGLLLPGGIDVDPILYDEDNIASYSTDPEKDNFERQLFYSFKNVHKPVFGICRGLQLIMREFLRHNPSYQQKITFYQHVNKHSLATDLQLERSNPSHSIWALRNILYGEKEKHVAVKMYVNSMHHQAVIVRFDKANKKRILTMGALTFLAFTRAGLAEKDLDDIVEAVEIHGWLGGEIRAVQWHPEELKDYALIQTFFGQEKKQGTAGV